MRKILAMLLITAVMFSLGACGGTEKKQADMPTASESPAVQESPEIEESPEIQESPQLAEETPAPDGSGETEEIQGEDVSEDETVTGDKELDELSELIASAIVTDEMDNLAKARAVYDFVRSSINYSGNSDKTDWKIAAKEGLKTRQGDCYTYYACARALLTYMGIDNREVRRVDGRSDHWWNLVNCGSGWYHMDATPMGAEMPAFNAFMFTDEQAKWYTDLVQYEVGLTNFYSFNGDVLPERAS